MPARIVDVLAGVFFEMNAQDADGLARGQGELAVLADGGVVLRDLDSPGQVGVEVVLAREDRLAPDAAAERQAGADGELDSLLVQDRQDTGQAQADRAGVGIRVGAKARRAPAEDLGLGGELGVDLEPDGL